MICTVAHKCGGCTDFYASNDERLLRKKEPVMAFLKPYEKIDSIAVIQVGEEGVRDKVDLQYRDKKWGFLSSEIKNPTLFCFFCQYRP